MADIILDDVLALPVVGRPGDIVNLNDLLLRVYNELPTDIKIFYITPTDPGVEQFKFSYWTGSQSDPVLNTHVAIDGDPINSLTSRYVTESGLYGNPTYDDVSIVIGRNIMSNVYIDVKIGSVGSDAIIQRLAITTVPEQLWAGQTGPYADWFGSEIVLPSDIVAAARRVAANYTGLINQNDCHNIARVVGASAGATLGGDSGDLDPTKNQDGGFWRVVHRGSDNPEADWQKLVQPGDIVSFGWTNVPVGQVNRHTLTVTEGINAAGQIRVLDNGGGRISEHLADYDGALSRAETVTIYRLDPNHRYLIQGTDNGELVFGTVLNDELRGRGGVDQMHGGTGNDMIDGGAGADEMHGGAGDDTYYVDNVSDRIIEEPGLAGGNDTVVILANEVVKTARASYTLNDNVEHAIVEGNISFDVIGNASDNGILGNDQANHLLGYGGADRLYGMGGKDTLDGGLGADELHGDAGDDTLVATYEKTPFFVDIYDGGADIDTVDFRSFTKAIWVDLMANGREVWTKDTASLTTGTWRAVADLNAIENVLGGERADEIFGDNGINGLGGMGGNDKIYGRGGNDLIHGGEGADELFGGFQSRAYATTFDGDDTIFGAGGDDTITVLWGNDQVHGEAGIDTLAFTDVTANLTLNLASGRASYSEGGTYYDAALNPVGGFAGIYTVTWDGIENLTGGGGGDDITGDGGKNVLVGGLGGDTLHGGEKNDTLFGGFRSRAETTGFDGDDEIFGDGGADTITVLFGNDKVHGGAGSDTLSFAEVRDNLVLNLAAGSVSYSESGSTADGTQVWGGRYFVTWDGIENLAGGVGSDTITGAKNNNTLTGNGGKDTFAFATGWGADTVTDFTKGQDMLDMTHVSGLTSISQLSITSTAQGAIIAFGADSILLTGLAAGGLNASDFLFKTAPVAPVVTTQIGTSGNDTLNGTSGADRLEGREGMDWLTGGAGPDQLLGGSGTDFLYVDADDTLINGGSGFDYVYLDSSKSYGATFKVAGTEVEYVGGTLADDTIDATGVTTYNVSLMGNHGDDVLIGGSLHDTLQGTVGKDTLEGAAGNDTLIGGTDADTFVFRTGAGGLDRITDFSRVQGDVIDFTAHSGVNAMANLTITSDAAGNAVVNYVDGQITLAGIAAGAVQQDWFHF